MTREHALATSAIMVLNCVVLMPSPPPMDIPDCLYSPSRGLKVLRGRPLGGR